MVLYLISQQIQQIPLQRGGASIDILIKKS